MFAMFSRVMENISCCNLNNGNILREVTVKIELERIDTQKEMTVKALVDSGAMELVISSEFTRKQGFKLKKIERPIYVRNMDGTSNKKRLIEHTVEVNIYYQEYRKRTEIDVIGGQKWNIILEMPWLAYYNPEINWRTGEVKIKIKRCPEKCGKWWKPKQGKSGLQKQKNEEKRE